jgi:hypothetical protein
MQRNSSIVKCGCANPERRVVISKCGLNASEVWYQQSGHWMGADGSGYLALCTDGTENMIGWGEYGPNASTSSSTAGADVVDLDVSFETLYWMPASATGVAVTEATLKAALFETCDLYVTGNIQYADIGTATDKVFLILDYRYLGATLGQQFVLVQRVPVSITND